MTDRHWMPFYVADHVADTMHLSALEHGAYMFMILHYWRAGSLPSSEAELRRISRLSATHWRGARKNLMGFFMRDGDAYRHKRIDAEMSEANARIEAKTQQTRAATAMRWRKRGTQTESVTDCVTQTQPHPHLQPPLEKEEALSLDEFLKAYDPPINFSRPDTQQAWAETQGAHPPAPDMLAAVTAYCQWLEAQKRAYKSDYPKQHPANWLRQRKWENFAVRPSAADDRDALRALWNGAAAGLVDKIGAPSFQGYFSDAAFEPGPPARITASSPFKQSQIERNYLSKLRAIFGEDVEVVAK